jgi:hypothetical protein
VLSKLEGAEGSQKHNELDVTELIKFFLSKANVQAVEDTENDENMDRNDESDDDE